MKKLFTLSCLVMLSILSNAQIKKVSYRGAFAPAPTPAWTDGWANFDPNNTVYPSPTAAPAAGFVPLARRGRGRLRPLAHACLHLHACALRCTPRNRIAPQYQGSSLREPPFRSAAAERHSCRRLACACSAPCGPLQPPECRRTGSLVGRAPTCHAPPGTPCRDTTGRASPQPSGGRWRC